MSYLAYEDMPTENSHCQQEGIRCLVFNRFHYKYKDKLFRDQSSIVYLSETEESLCKLNNVKKSIVILSESFRQDRNTYICCFVIKNELIDNINFNVLKDYTHFIGEDYSLFVFRGDMDTVIEDIEYLKTLDIEFEFLTENHTYEWKDI